MSWWPLSGDARDESETPRDGFLSTTVEIHAAGIGAIFAVLFLITGNVGIVAFFAAVIMGKAKVQRTHLKDAAKEAGYSGGAFVVVYLLGTVL